jgi:hypothetical protein
MQQLRREVPLPCARYAGGRAFLVSGRCGERRRPYQTAFAAAKAKHRVRVRRRLRVTPPKNLQAEGLSARFVLDVFEN